MKVQWQVSATAAAATNWNDPYTDSVRAELGELSDRIRKSELPTKIKMLLLYVPLASKMDLVNAFDAKLKGLQ
jgi:hypothetical protein